MELSIPENSSELCVYSRPMEEIVSKSLEQMFDNFMAIIVEAR